MNTQVQLFAAIPSPSQSEWQLGPLPIRAYAICILAGIFFAVWLTMRRWAARGGNPDDIIEISFWAVPFGIVGGRIYHVISSPAAYFGEGGRPVDALKIWEGGLGIWGAVALGAVGAWIGCRRLGIKLSSFADALAPGLLFAQAIGRLGNWFNQELFGKATDLPWGLEISPEHLPPGYEVGTLFHPTFLYEMLWNIAGAFFLIWVGKRFDIGHGRLFLLYIVVYCTGRLWIEMLRIDPAESVFGLRINIWTSLLVGIGGVVAFILVKRRHPGRDETVWLDPESHQEPETVELDD